MNTLLDTNGGVFNKYERQQLKKRLKAVSSTLGSSNITKATTHRRTLMNRIRRRQRENFDGHVTKIESYLQNIVRSLHEFKSKTFRSIPTSGPFATMTQRNILPRYKLDNFSRLRWAGGNVGRQRGIRVVLKPTKIITATLNRYERAYHDVKKHAVFSERSRGATNRVARIGREIMDMIREMRDTVRMWERVQPQKRAVLQRIFGRFEKTMYS